MIVQPDFPDHWKTRQVIKAIDSESAVRCILRLWAHCQQRRRWIFRELTPVMLSAICGWEGDGQRFWDAMIGTFVDQTSDGYEVHQWAEINKSLLANWERGEHGKKGGRPRKNPQGSSKVSPGFDQGNLGLTLGKPDKRREEKIRKEISDPRFAPITDGYGEAYAAEIGSPYVHQGGKDGKALKDFLARLQNDVSAEYVVKVARSALRRCREPFAKHAKHASTLHGFCHGFNDIKAELVAEGKANKSKEQFNGSRAATEPTYTTTL